MDRPQDLSTDLSIVRRHDKSERWREVRFLVFDAPAITEPFEARMTYLRDAFAELRPQRAELLAHERCLGTAHLQAELGASRRWAAKE